jgi:hypothetical protein
MYDTQSGITIGDALRYIKVHVLHHIPAYFLPLITHGFLSCSVAALLV